MAASDPQPADGKNKGRTNKTETEAPAGKTQKQPSSGGEPEPTRVIDDSPTGGRAQNVHRRKRVTRLGDFQLVKKLGKGGMGTVYLAKQVSLDRPVALKTLSKELAGREDFVKRFLREARAMAKLQHQNVVQVYAADSDQGYHFVALEYIDGRSMQDWMDCLNRLPISDSVHVVLVCADALKHAHEMNMIHRDVKPANILVTKKGVIKVADFGLAKAVDDDTALTQSGAGLGTPLYMAPEQARNAKHVDRSTDVYALGITLYYFLTGQFPFTGDTALELILAKEKGQFRPARRLNPEVPERLDLMIDKMIAKTPAHRYADCGELIRDLKTLHLHRRTLGFLDPRQAETEESSDSAGRLASTVIPKHEPTRSTEPRPASPQTQRQTAASGTKRTWFVEHRNAEGKVIVSKLSTPHIQKALRGGTMDLRAKAKRKADDTFLPLAQFPEFSELLEQRLVQAKAEARFKRIEKMYTQFDKQERRRRRWRWLRDFVHGTKEVAAFVVYLAILGAAGYAVWTYGIPWIKGFFSE